MSTITTPGNLTSRPNCNEMAPGKSFQDVSLSPHHALQALQVLLLLLLLLNLMISGMQ